MTEVIEFSPPKRLKQNETEEVEILILAPFKPPPKVTFHNVKLNSRAVRRVIIRNPSQENIAVELLNLPADDRCFEFNFTNTLLPPGEEALLEIIWNPREPGNWRESISVRTSSKVKSEIKIISSCIQPKPTKIVRKPPVSKSSSKPTFLAKKQYKPPLRSASPRLLLPKSAASSPCRRQTFVVNVENKENTPFLRKNVKPLQKNKHDLSRRFEDLVLSPLNPNLHSVKERFTALDDLVMSPAIPPSGSKESFSVDIVDGGMTLQSKDIKGVLTNCADFGNALSVDIRRETFAVDRNMYPPHYSVKPSKSETAASKPAIIVSDYDEPDEFSDSLEEPYLEKSPFHSPDMHRQPLESVNNTRAPLQERDLNNSTIVFDLPSPSDDPRRCSTGVKASSRNSSLSATGAVCRDLFEKADSPTIALQMSDPSALHFNISSMRDSLNGENECGGRDRLSSDTYVKDRWSTGTFVKEQHSRGSSVMNENSLETSAFSDDSLLMEKNIKGAVAGRPSPKMDDNHQQISKSPLLPIEEEVFAENKESAVVDSKSKSFAFTVPFSVTTDNQTSTQRPIVKLRTTSVENKPGSTSRRKIPVSPSLKISTADGCFVRKKLFTYPGPSKTTKKSDRASSQTSQSSSKSVKKASVSSHSRASLSSKLPETTLSLSSSNLSVKGPDLTSSKLLRGSRRVAELQSAKSEILCNPDDILAEVTNVDPYAASTTVDPFLCNSIYNDSSWLDRQERDIIKWLNALLTPPAELNADTDLPSIDVGDLWQKTCRLKDVSVAPSREEVSSELYGKQNRLNTLRKAALALYRSKDVACVLQKISISVDKKLLSIREDRDLHLDIGLQKFVLELLLCYNPLWLRIGLEVIYGRTVPLKSNSDYLGLVTFIQSYLMHDAHIVSSYSHPTVPHLKLPGFQQEMKKFMLKKFLFIVYYLDCAKRSKLISHDPCLFMLSAQYKESKEIAVAFARELLAGIGDIKRHLAAMGCNLTVKQSYLDEFPFGIKSLLDLRDGVRLARIMELLLNRKDLTTALRVPAISRLQKVHNVEVALNALKAADYVICGDIQAKHIVEGHRERTLSLLWQIIYKFRAPRFSSAALVIQQWWRRRGLAREVERRIRARKRALREAAAVTLQAAWRGLLVRRGVRALRAARLEAAVVLQKHWRRRAAQQQLFRARRAASVIAQWYRGARMARNLRAAFLQKRAAAVKVQALWRGVLTRKRFGEVQQMAAALRIQTWFRRRRAARRLLALSDVARGWVAEQQARRRACERIQVAVRAWIAQRRERSAFLALRSACVSVQRLFRARLVSRRERARFLCLRRATVTIQRRFRAQRDMRIDRTHFMTLRRATCTLQVRVRATLQMRACRVEYQHLRSCVVMMQRKFRARRVMREVRERFLTLRKSVIMVQQFWRAKQAMERQRNSFITLKTASCVVQLRFRALLKMRRERAHYQQIRAAVLILQRRFRAVAQMRRTRASFLNLRKATIAIQQHWRVCLAMKQQHLKYVMMKAAAITLQRHYRAFCLMRIERNRYLQLQSAALNVQRRFRAIQKGKKERERYLLLRQSTLIIQHHWRAQRAMRKQRALFLSKVQAARVIQQWYRAQLEMRIDQAHYLQLRYAVLIIQRKFRAVQQARCDRNMFNNLRKATITIQRHWRAQQAMKRERAKYLTVQKAGLFLQSRVRAHIYMRSDQRKYQLLRLATLNIQRRFRAKKAMEIQRMKFISLRRLTIAIQRRWRAKKTIAAQLRIQNACIIMQRHWRAKKAAQQQLQIFRRTRNAVIMIQRWWRTTIVLKKEREKFELINTSAMVIQKHWRMWKAMQQQRAEFCSQKSAVIILQKWVRRFLARKKYLQLKEEAFRSKVLLNRSARIIQSFWRNWHKIQVERKVENCAAVKIQAVWRGYQSRKKYKEETQKLKELVDERAASAPEPEPLCMKERIGYLCFDLDRDTVGGVMIVLNSLHTISVLSPVLCEEMVRNNIVPKLFSHLCCLNRGVADCTIAIPATKILLNLTKYSETIDAVWADASYLNLYPYFMKKWVSVDESVLKNLVTILWHFAQNPQWAEIMLADDKLKSTILFLKSKYKAKKHKTPESSTVLPALSPNWASLRKGSRPVAFLDPLYGLHALCHKLKF